MHPASLAFFVRFPPLRPDGGCQISQTTYHDRQRDQDCIEEEDRHQKARARGDCNDLEVEVEAEKGRGVPESYNPSSTKACF